MREGGGERDRARSPDVAGRGEAAATAAAGEEKEFIADVERDG